ncbi:MAG: hypothetical protein ACE5EF_12335 [Dehalococcoidia bacterium]
MNEETGQDQLDEVQSQVADYEPLSGANRRLSDAIVAHAGHPDAWAKRLEKAVRDVAAAFQHHFEVAEGPDGHLHQIVDMSPSLIPKVTKQRHEHDELLVMVNHLADHIAEMGDLDTLLVERFRLEAEVVHDAIHMHLARAADLLFEAYFRDAGGEG